MALYCERYETIIMDLLHCTPVGGEGEGRWEKTRDRTGFVLSIVRVLQMVRYPSKEEGRRRLMCRRALSSFFLVLIKSSKLIYKLGLRPLLLFEL